MRQKKKNSAAVILLAAAVVLLSVFGPEQMARYKDRRTLNRITAREDGSGEGYRYTLSSNEKLFLLAECLSRQTLPESERSAMIRAESQDTDYEELLGTYAFVVNRQGPSGKEITEEEIFSVCSRELEELAERGVIPAAVKETAPDSYSAALYSAIDVLEPQNNLSVWKISLLTDQQNTAQTNRLIEAYLDADSGKIYGFYVRTEHTWAEMDPEEMVREWSSYLELSGMESWEASNPLLETASDYEKYRFPGMEGESTIVTIGFYEGIRELFLRIF